jgi:hypothetical protein
MSIQLCGAQGGNTGLINCAVSPDKIATIAIWGGNLTSSEYDTDAHIKTALLADSKLPKADSNKLFVLPLVENKENKKEANQEQAFSNGVKIVTREGLPGWRFSFFTNMSQMIQLRKFNNKRVPVIMQDISKNVWGTKDGSLNFIGRQAIVFFEGLDHPGDDQAAGVGYFTVAFLDPIENYDDAVFVASSFNFQTTLKALIDVQAYEKAVATVNVLHISGKVPTAQIGNDIDIYADSAYTALFATAADWTATNLTTGASIAITTLAANAAGYGDMTLNSAAYTALASGTQVKIAAIAANLLDAAGFVGIEIAPVIHTKP